MSPVNNEIIRIACYIRVSTQEQKLHGISLDAQRDKLKEYADKHGLKIVAWYEDEGVSGRKLIRNRPALQRMIKDAQAGKFDRIIFIKLDRFFRSVAEYHECMKKIEPVLWTATEEKYDLTTANGRAFVNMKITIAELEADQTGERIRIVNDYKVKTGQALMGSSSCGLGYMVKKDENGVKRVVKDPETAPHLEDFIKHLLTHNSKRAALEYVNNKYGTNYNLKNFQKKIYDTKLYGHYRGNDDYCEAYVDKATFDKIQELKKKNIKVSAGRKTYLFSGLLRCPVCGDSMTGKFCGKQVDRRSNGKTYVYHREYYYYRCKRLASYTDCNFTKLVKEPDLETVLLDKLDHYITGHIAAVKIEDKKEVRDDTEKRIEKVKKEMEKLKRMYRKDDITEAEYDKEMDSLKATLKELESHLEPVLERDLTIYHDLLKSDWRSLYEALNKENKRAFWRKYVKQIVITAEGTVDRVIFF